MHVKPALLVCHVLLKFKQLMEGKVEGTRKGRWGTEEILDQRGARTDGDWPGEMQQSGRRQASMVKHDRGYPSRGGDRQVTKL